MTPLGPEQLARTAEGHGPRSVEHVTVIRVVATRGLGEHSSVFREVTSYWLPDGTKLVEDDPAPRVLPGDCRGCCTTHENCCDHSGSHVPTTGGHP